MTAHYPSGSATVDLMRALVSECEDALEHQWSRHVISNEILADCFRRLSDAKRALACELEARAEEARRYRGY